MVGTTCGAPVTGDSCDSKSLMESTLTPYVDPIWKLGVIGVTVSPMCVQCNMGECWENGVIRCHSLKSVDRLASAHRDQLVDNGLMEALAWGSAGTG